MKTHLNAFYLVFLFILSSHAYSFSYDSLTNLSVPDGLPSTIVRSIVQGNDGYIWIGTKHGLLKYDGYSIETITNAQGVGLGDIWSLAVHKDGTIYIASKTKGLFKYASGLVVSLSDEIKATSVYLDSNMVLWVGALDATYQYDGGKFVLKQKFKKQISYGFLNFDSTHVLAITNKKITKININNSSKESIATLPENNKNNKVIHKDSKGNIWLGKEDGLYRFEKNCSCFKQFSKELEEKIVYSLESNDDYLWVGTIRDDLYRYEYRDDILVKVSENIATNISEAKSILSLFYDNAGVLWVGTFFNGLYLINPNILNFQSDFSKRTHQGCANSFSVHDIYKTDDGLLIATESGLVHLQSKNSCKKYNHTPNNENSLFGDLLLSINQTSNQDIWISNSKSGIDKFNLKESTFEHKAHNNKNISFYFSFEIEPNVLILGSAGDGVYRYDILNDVLSKIPNKNEKFNSSRFYMYTISANNEYYFGTDNGVVYLNQDNIIEELEFSQSKNLTEITALSFDKNNDLWIGADYQYLFKYSSHSGLENITSYLAKPKGSASIFSLIPINDHTLWFSSSIGLFKLDTNTYESWLFTSKDGLQNTGYLLQSFHYDIAGKIYFGGKKGVTSFYPNHININNQPPKVAITKFAYFNKQLKIGDSTKSNFKLNKPINYLEKIELGYQDYIIGFEFAALDYADSMRNQYAYRLLGLNDDWVYVDADSRRATYTNLSSGDYVFQVKASNKDGVWSQKPKELKIIVNPAPWHTLWAYLSYVLIILFSLWVFIRYKTHASIKRANKLEKLVENRTQEVVVQKKMVEALLQHKNEVFANITHEFKTPLSLILGPTDQLSHKLGNQYSSELNMIRRNANRLLLMVRQILKLSQAEQNKDVKREPQAIQPILLMLYESFKPLADNKNIDLQMKNEVNANINATTECLEIVIGNLLSNALKFTNPGGFISIISELSHSQVIISVSDTGPGIEKSDIKKIFNRFIRLESHRNVAGTGIGLSVAKEITEANSGFIDVISKWGKGSIFKVTFPITKLKPCAGLSQTIVDQMVTNINAEMSHTTTNQIIRSNKNIVSVLVIEDNLDMQEHINNVLKQHFYCMFADRGRKGVAIALKEIPDVVICDVMMPAMDGYQVTRILRHDSRTSHIPIVMLTALNTKESRIKGWRENIDTYITKPFDSTELITQLKNILTIRKILQSQTNNAIKNNIPLSSIDLPKQDQKFIEKLRDVITKHYVNEYFQVADIAAKMAVSERQLQRKIKALINESPMEMLRDYRLKKSTMELKDGYQVGIVSDSVGFSSVSYFSRCFKKKYGMTPKRYQTINKKERKVLISPAR